MKVLILGGDGYLGWPTSMHIALKGHDVVSVDNYMRRLIAQETDSEALIPTPNLTERARLLHEQTGKSVKVRIANCADMLQLGAIFEEETPDVVIHYAEQPSAPYSMMGFSQAQRTLRNNLDATFNVVWAVMQHAPDCHIIKLGTMGEYGTPDIDIEEGWIDIEHKGRKDKFLFPRAAGSLYHTTKVLDTDLLWFYVRTYGIRVTDLMQGPVYGLETDAANAAEDEALLPNFHYDDIFGTLVNRFLVQAAAGVPLTVYGKGGQKRGYLNLKDTLQCVELALESPVPSGELRILNQFTETFSVNELADRVQRVGTAAGLDVAIKNIPNPRKEKEEHHYNPTHSGLIDLGLKPTLMTDERLSAMLDVVLRYRDNIDARKIMPRVVWNKG